MKRLITQLYLTVCISFCSALTADELVIPAKSQGMIVTKLKTATVPDKLGMVLEREVTLPQFRQGVYYRPFSKPGRGWIARGNRVEAVAFKSIAHLQNYQPSITRKGHDHVQQGQFVLLQLLDDSYLALLPMVSDKVYGQFFVKNNKLYLRTGNFGTNAIRGDIPLVIYARGQSPYEATKLAWQQVFKSEYVTAQPRYTKQYPEQPYGYLGWCSWEHYKHKISETVITDAFKTLEQSGAPIRWVMVDDGYLDAKNGKLMSFGLNQKKFPNGWQPIINLKNEDKIKWVGIWRNFGGYMSGVASDHTMDDLAPFMAPTKHQGTVMPNGTAEGAKAFYDKMVTDTKQNGFDFIKVDFHTRAFDLYHGTADPIAAMRNNSEALENATQQHDVPLLNCIAQPNINSMQTKYSAITRSSPDYNHSNKDKNKANTYQSFANHLWMGQTVWGDLDMFHTHDLRDVKPMAIARAISGGPVYISDEPSKVVPEVLYPFAYEDGQLLRTSAPATLLPESFFIHPFRDDNVFRVIAPMADGIAAIALFNFTESGKNLVSGFTAKDYRHAGELLQPNSAAWTVPSDGLLVFDRESKSIVDLDDGFKTTIKNFDAKLYFLYPKTKGWAVIGRIDKYLPSAAVKLNAVSKHTVNFTLQESGPLLIWSDSGKPTMANTTLKSLGNNLYLADLPISSGSKNITMTR